MIFNLKRLTENRKKQFHQLSLRNNLLLDYQINKNEIALLNSIFEKREYADFFPFYQKVTIIDIGAHYGYFSLFARNNTDINSDIIAIEPNKSNFEHLEKNLTHSKVSNIKSFNYGVSSKSGKSKLYHGQSPNHSIIDDYSLLTDKGFEQIEVKTLEDVIIENNLSKIDFLKLDCEGAEYEILENLPKYIYDRITTIAMEFHDLKNINYTGQRICNTLIKNGFEIVKYKYDETLMNLNYGKIIGTKIFNTFRTNNG